MILKYFYKVLQGFTKYYKAVNLQSLNTHSIQQPVGQISQKGIEQYQKGISNKHRIYLLTMHHNKRSNRNCTKHKSHSENNSQYIKVYAILFT
jgi:hypothetical protein